GKPSLNVALGYTPSIGDTFTILSAAGGVTGTFEGLADGAIITVGAARLQIHYGATDITLTCVSPAVSMSVSAPGTWAPGAPLLVTVTALDNRGNVSTDYTGTIQFSSTSGLTGLPASYMFTATDFGTHTFTVVPSTAGAQTVGVQDMAAGFG